MVRTPNEHLSEAIRRARAYYTLTAILRGDSFTKSYPYPTAKRVCSVMGFDRANKNGFIEEHKDCHGPNFKRSETAWDDNWDYVYGK